MKLTVKRLVLQSLVDKTGNILAGSGRDALPVLKNFYIEAVAGNPPKLRIVATDLELAVIADTEVVVVEEPGASIVPAKKLIEMVKEAGDCDIVLSTNGEVATITTPSTAWSLALMKDTYPPVPDVTQVKWVEVPANSLTSGLRKVRNAISSDANTRPELTLVKCGPDGIMATDGVRLHVADVQIPVDFELPVKAVDDLVRMMRGVQETSIRIAQTEQQILFEIANNVFIATKLQVQFPSIDYILKLRTAATMELQVAREDLISAIRRVRVTADEETNRVILTLENHKLTVQTRDKMGGSCINMVSVHWPHGKSVFATNHTYLSQAMSDMDSPNIRLLFGQDKGKQKAPIVVEEPNFFAIVNQLRSEE